MKVIKLIDDCIEFYTTGLEKPGRFHIILSGYEIVP